MVDPKQYCTTCGNAVAAGDRFCSKCGATRSVSGSSGADSKGDGSPANHAETPPAGVPTSPLGTSNSEPSGVNTGAASEGSSAGTTPQPGGPLPPPPALAHPKPKRRLVLVLAIVGAAVIVAAAGVGVAIALHHTHADATGSITSTSSPSRKVVSYTSFESEYATLKGAIVKIQTIGCDGNDYVGTGFAISPHSIVTAGHVIEGAQSMTVTDGMAPLPVQVIGLDASGDIALLHSDATIPKPYIPLDSSDPQVGQRVAAIGFPLGGGLTMTQGSVSALGQVITVNSTKLAGLVQTDTALNPGNSGGPLIALNGEAGGIVDALNTQANATGYAIDPSYAYSEVSHWIASPGSYPLPLCSTPDPLNSVAVSSGQPAAPSGNEATSASAVAALLAQSADARSTVIAATQAVENCTADPDSQIPQMSAAEAQRTSALQQLGSINANDFPDGSTMISDLSAAFNASNQADQGYAAWMSDVEGTQCPYATSSDSNYQAASAASSQAVAAKSAFLALWNPIAAQFNLTQYSQDQI